MNRLFVPLKYEAFSWFESGKKKWELRGINRNFNIKTVIIGRKVELSKGYSKKRISGRITERTLFDNLEDISKRMNFKEIIPVAYDENEFLKICNSYLSKYESFIAFKIEMDKRFLSIYSK